MSVCSGWAGAAEVVLHENSSGQEVIVRRGDRLVVRLSSNRTTGYSWDEVITRPGKLTQQGVPLYRPARDRHLVGVGGLEIWSFRAIHRGHTKLIFHYARPWERGIPPVRTLFWLITIP